METNIHNNETVLYGVPKVEYGINGITPYPVCLTAAANYLGQDIDYETIMVGSGAAFRLTWNTAAWDGGNVDVVFTYDDPVKIYRAGVESLGREFRLLGRSPKTKKEEFSSFIKERIDIGTPVIALGIIGPPEACLITGYRNGGDTLLGWNFFQGDPEFGSTVTFDESGYFITDCWWENSDTRAVIGLGEISGDGQLLKTVTANAIEVMTGRVTDGYAKGVTAYEHWKRYLLDESQFPENAIMPILAERIMCHGDAMDCLADGRPRAAEYFRRAAEKFPEHSAELKEIAGFFGRTSDNAMKMYGLLGGFERGETQMRALANPNTRKETCALIDACKASDEKALDALKRLIAAL